MKRWHLIVGSALIAIPIEWFGSETAAWSAVVAQVAFLIGVDLGYIVGKLRNS